jgi:hypothetical protein
MNRKNSSILCAMLLILTTILLTACGVLEVRGKTFVYESVKIDWGMASEDDKEVVYEQYLVSNETELLAVLKTRNSRNERMTTFGTDGTYSTVNKDNEVLDRGYYRQDSDVITLADTEEGFANEGNFTLKANEKGYKVSDLINEEFSVFAVYQFVVKD